MEKELILTTKRLTIRKFKITDTSKIYRLSQEEGIKKWLPDQVYKDHDQSNKVLKYLISRYKWLPDSKKSPYVFAVEAKHNNILIGHIGLSPVGQDLEIGYGISKKYQNKGFGTELVKEFTVWSLNYFNLDTVWGIVDKRNYASIKVLKKSKYILSDQKEDKLYYLYKR